MYDMGSWINSAENKGIYLGKVTIAIYQDDITTMDGIKKLAHVCQCFSGKYRYLKNIIFLSSFERFFNSGMDLTVQWIFISALQLIPSPTLHHFSTS